MTPEQFEREKLYTTLMMLTDEMLKSGVISQKENEKLDGYFRQKYRPIRIFRVDLPARYLVESSSQGRC